MSSLPQLNLVDLAGSERIDKSGSADTPLRLREALNINKSLLCLGNVVTALAERSEGKRSNHIPYRDSKLTRLLEDSLGGNATTALVACITPLPEWHLEQSRNTLEFAARAARIVCKPQRNVLSLAPAGGVPSAADAAALIAALQAEVAALKQQLAEQQPSQPPQLHALSVVPVSCSTSLWDGGGVGGVGGVVLTSRGSGVLAGVAEEHGEEAGETDSECGSPTAASCPTSPSGRHSPTGRRGWTTRLRMSLTGGSSLFASHDGTLGLSSADSSKGGKGSALLHSPSRIPSPKHSSLFSALANPRFAGKPSGIPSGPAGGEQQAVASAAPVAAIQTHPAAQPSDEGNSSSNPGALPASAHTTSIISRASGTHKSLLWKLLQQPHPHDRGHQPLLHHRASNSGGGGSSNRATHSAASLRSAGLLITSSGNAASAAAAVAAASHAAAAGGGGGSIFQRWATFSGGRVSPVSTASLTTAAAHVQDSGSAAVDTHGGGGTAVVPSHPLQQLATYASSSLCHTGRSSLASRRLTTDGATWGATGGGGGCNMGGPDGRQVGLLDSVASTHTSSLESRMTAAEAAMALRDHIIKQLVLALQQKKAEIRALKEQLASVLKQLESSEGEEATNKAKLRELAEGIQVRWRNFCGGMRGVGKWDRQWSFLVVDGCRFCGEVSHSKRQNCGWVMAVVAGGGRMLTLRALLPSAAQMLAAARQEEFERWKGHLVGLEAALQAAQSEATNYRFVGKGGAVQCSAVQGRAQCTAFGSWLHTHTYLAWQVLDKGLTPACTQASGQVVRHVCCPCVCRCFCDAGMNPSPW